MYGVIGALIAGLLAPWHGTIEVLGAAGRRDSVRALGEAELPRVTAPATRKGVREDSVAR